MPTRLILGAAALALALFACSTEEHGLGDAGVGSYDDSKAEVVQMPDGFPNLATKCDNHGHRVYVNTRSAGNVVVINDPSCPGAKAGG